MKKNIRQFFITFFTLSLSVLSLSFSSTPIQAQEETIKIGVLQYVEHDALDAVLEGFTQTLDNSDYADQIEWDIQNANGDQASLQSISEKITRENDILFAIATPAAQALATVEKEKPIFIAAVTDPVEAGLADSLEEPGKNITGTSDMQPLDQQVELLINNFPEAETVGIIYNSSEVNSKVQADQAVELLEAEGLTVDVQTITSTNDIAQILGTQIENVDAMFMVTDNTIDSAITLVGDIAKNAGVPTIGSSDSVVLQNGLMTISNSYKDYGVQTAEMVIRMLDEDLSVSEMPIELGQNFEVVVNEEFAEALGLDPASLQ